MKNLTLAINDDKMAPLLRKGDRALITFDSSWDLSAGDIVFFEGQISRVIQKSSSGITLIKDNDYFSLQTAHSFQKGKVIGRVRGGETLFWGASYLWVIQSFLKFCTRYFNNFPSKKVQRVLKFLNRVTYG